MSNIMKKVYDEGFANLVFEVLRDILCRNPTFGRV